VFTDNLHQLTSLHRLTSLHIKTPNLTDDTLIKFSNLTALYLQDSDLITDASLQKLTKLKILDIFSPFSSITESSLMKLQNLTALNIGNTQILITKLLTHPTLTHLSPRCSDEDKEKMDNSGIILYDQCEWLSRFTPTPLVGPPTISPLNLMYNL
jgi:Leucine-rich repeat (LRR) protein